MFTNREHAGCLLAKALIGIVSEDDLVPEWQKDFREVIHRFFQTV